MRIHGPDMKMYMDKKLQLKLNRNRVVTGTLRGYDQFMNVTLEGAKEITKDKETPLGLIVIRGNSIDMLESLEALQ
jgi:small nuclear ribonucleoprotein G